MLRQACLLIASASLSTALRIGNAALHESVCSANPVVMQVAHTDVRWPAGLASTFTVGCGLVR